MPEIKPPELAGRWEMVGIGDSDVYAPSNAPIGFWPWRIERAPLDGLRAQANRLRRARADSGTASDGDDG